MENKAVAVFDKRKSIVFQGNKGEVISTRTNDKGEVVPTAIEYRVKLKPGIDYFEADNKLMITSNAYYKANPGISIITPQTIIVEGNEQSNPYVEREPTTRSTTAVWVRKLAVGRAPDGRVAASDCTIFFNVQTYFMQSIVSKSTTYLADIVLGTESFKPQEKATVEVWESKWIDGKKKSQKVTKEITRKLDRMIYLPMDSIMGVWINIDSNAYITLIKEHIQRQKFAERIASTIAERTALRKHPSFGGGQIIKTESGCYLSVKHSFETVNMDNIQQWLRGSGIDETEETFEVADQAEVIAEVENEIKQEDTEGFVEGDYEDAPDPEPPKEVIEEQKRGRTKKQEDERPLPNQKPEASWGKKANDLFEEGQ